MRQKSRTTEEYITRMRVYGKELKGNDDEKLWLITMRILWGRHELNPNNQYNQNDIQIHSRNDHKLKQAEN